MHQTVRREALKSHFVPNSGAGSADRLRDVDIRAAWSGAEDHATYVAPAYANKRPVLARKLFRAAMTVFWSLAGEKALASAMSQQRASGALLSGSLAAGTAYMQERHARRAPLASPHANAKRSLFSFYAAMGMGLGLGAMLVNRRRG